MSTDRVTELELRFTEQQHLLEELSDVVFRQQRELDAVKAELSMMKRKMDALEPGVIDGGPAEKPPHY